MCDIGRKWQARRVVITRTKICFAFVGEESLIDHIPLSDADYIMEMKDDAGDEEENDTRQRHRIQIATLTSGYNSGRTYYLAAYSKELAHRLIDKLRKYAKVERKRAEASSLFRKWQLKVRKRYESGYVQGAMAMMIAAVRKLANLTFVHDGTISAMRIENG